MQEIIENRSLRSKTFDLGKGRRRLEVHKSPIHRLQNGRFEDLDLTPRAIGRDIYQITAARADIRISQTIPSYRYNAVNGKLIDVELLCPAKTCTLKGRVFHYPLSDAAGYTIYPTSKACTTRLWLSDASAPRRWQWKIIGDKTLLRPIIGRDSAGNPLELDWSIDESKDLLTVIWKGTLDRKRLRTEGAKTIEPVFPVWIDPTADEDIAAGADDRFEVWFGTVYVGASGNHSKVYAKIASFSMCGGLRFQTVGVPADATITGATLSVFVLNKLGASQIQIWGADVDSAAAWGPANRALTIPKTTAYVSKSSWSVSTTTDIGVTGIISEILGRSGWASNNNLAFLVLPIASGGVTFAALEHATAPEAHLSIDYETAGGGTGLAVGHGLTRSILLNPRTLVN